VHAAPAVRVSLGRSAAWAAFAGGCAALAAANAVAWALLQSQDAHEAGVLAAALGAAALAATAAATVAWRTQPVGELRWDGVTWHGPGVSGQARVALDIGNWMLLRLAAPDGTARWFAVSRRATTGPWAALRAALHAPPAAGR
jgi:hypothetical protein